MIEKITENVPLIGSIVAFIVGYVRLQSKASSNAEDLKELASKVAKLDVKSISVDRDLVVMQTNYEHMSRSLAKIEDTISDISKKLDRILESK